MLIEDEHGHLLWQVAGRDVDGRCADKDFWGDRASGFIRGGAALLERAGELSATPGLCGDTDDGLTDPMPDELVVPGLYLIRHGVELLLKMLVLCKAENEGARGEVRMKHHLDTLWPSARAILLATDGADYLPQRRL